MLFRRWGILFTALCFILFSNFARSEDYTKFLALHEIEMSEDSSKGRDRFGNQYVVQQNQGALSYAQIGISIIAESMALPNAPIFPVFLHGTDDRILAGTAQALLTSTSINFSKLSALQNAQFLSLVGLNFVFGNSSLDNGIRFVEGNFTLLRALQPFQFSATSPFANIPVELMNGISEENAKGVADHLKGFLDRLDGLSSNSLKEVFGPYFRETQSDHSAEILSRIKVLRRNLAEFLSSVPQMKPYAETLLQQPKVEVPHIGIPKTFDSVPPSPLDALWYYYFQSERKNLPDRALIESLQQKAISGSGPIYFVSELMTEKPNSRHQLALNPHNSKTLFAVSENDREAREIVRIAQEDGAKLIKFDLKHGVELTAGMADDIIARAKSLHCDRIVIVEMPENSPGIEAKIRASGFSLIIVDHHSRNEDRSNPESSLEQSANILGHSITPSEKIVGVLDRASIFGLRDLGVGNDIVKHYLANPHGNSAGSRLFREVRNVVPTKTTFGNLYIFPDLNYAMGAIASAFGALEYPKIPNVLILGSTIRFSGRGAAVALLDEIIKPYKGQLTNYYKGGDPGRSMFWGAQGLPKKVRFEILQRLRGCQAPLL